MRTSTSRERGRALCTCAALSLAALSLPAAAQVDGNPDLPSAREAVPARRLENAFLDLSAGLDYTDNVFRQQGNKDSDKIASLGLVTDLNRDGRLLDYTLRGDVAYRDYLDNSYGGQVYGTFDGLAALDIVPGSFQWEFRETYRQVSSDPRAAQTPDTLAGLNQFGTGPRLRIRFGSDMSAVLSGDYSWTQTDANSIAVGTEDVSGEQYGGSASLVRDLSPTSNAYLTVRNRWHEFDEPQVARDYDQRDTFVGYEARGSRTRLSTRLGYTEIDRQGDTSGGLLADVSIARRISPSSTLLLDASRTFTSADDPGSFNGVSGPDFGGGIPSTDLTIATTDPYTSTSYGIGWAYERQRTSLGVNLSTSKDRYETATQFDRRRREAGVYAERRLMPRLSLRLSGQYLRQRYEAADSEDEEIGASAGLSLRLARALHTVLRYEHFDRNGGQPGSSYAENRVGISFVYNAYGNSGR